MNNSVSLCQTHTASQTGKDHAIVMGASLAGLLAACVLSHHFQRVTLVERDHLPEGAENRKGVPQGQHLHTLLVKGEQIISRLFPGIDSDLIQAGAIRLDLADDFLWFQEGGYKPRFDSGITLFCMSRPLLERCIRRRVLAIKNLTCLQKCNVQNLVASEDRTHITGITVQQREAEASKELLEADLIVDATGRSSKSLKWLETLGYSRPKKSVVKIDVSYTTRVYQQDTALLPDVKGILTFPAPPHGKRSGALAPIEGERWMVTLAGWLGERAPAHEQGFLDYAKSLSRPDIYNVISQAQPIGDFVIHRLPSNLRQHYEQMKRFPDGYLVLGDAMCSFNPVYGQGMSVSAMEAEALDCALQAASKRNSLQGLAQDFFKRAARAIKNPWMMAAGEDFRFAGVEGPKPVGTDLINRYISQIHKTCDREITRTLLQVMTLTHPPKTLLDPRVILRVVWNRIQTNP